LVDPPPCNGFRWFFCRVESALISVTVNGDSRQFEQPLTCAGLVMALGLTGKRVALECNGEIVPRSALEARSLADGDNIEIVVAVGGG
jgi:sulfur carrier protein